LPEKNYRKGFGGDQKISEGAMQYSLKSRLRLNTITDTKPLHFSALTKIVCCMFKC